MSQNGYGPRFEGAEECNVEGVGSALGALWTTALYEMPKPKGKILEGNPRVQISFWPKIELLRSDTEHQPRRLILKQFREDYRTLRAPNTDQLSRRCTIKKITTHTPPPD